MTGHDLLTYEVSEFARTLARGTAVCEVLGDLAERTAALLGLTAAGVSVLESGLIRFTAATEDRAAALERVQEAGQAGPGVEACRTGMAVMVTDLSQGSPGWSRYQQAAQDVSIAAVASVPMRHGDESVGALDLYSASPRDWSAADLGVIGILADMATGYLVHARELDRQGRINEQLREALDSRIVIEQAKGVLAAERRISVDEAFEVLRRHARRNSTSLRSVAEAVVSLGLRP